MNIEKYRVQIIDFTECQIRFIGPDGFEMICVLNDPMNDPFDPSEPLYYFEDNGMAWLDSKETIQRILNLKAFL